MRWAEDVKPVSRPYLGRPIPREVNWAWVSLQWGVRHPADCQPSSCYRRRMMMQGNNSPTLWLRENSELFPPTLLETEQFYCCSFFFFFLSFFLSFLTDKTGETLPGEKRLQKEGNSATLRRRRSPHDNPTPNTHIIILNNRVRKIISLRGQ